MSSVAIPCVMYILHKYTNKYLLAIGGIFHLSSCRGVFDTLGESLTRTLECGTYGVSVQILQ